MSDIGVVLVHGWRLTGTMWHPQQTELDRHRRVVAPDLPGHGSRAAEPFDLDTAVRVVTEAVDEVGGRALVVGMSLGGYVAIATAARHPDKVAGLMAMGCTARVTLARTLPYRLVSRLGDSWQRRMFRIMVGREAARAALAGGVYGAVTPRMLDALCRFDPVAALASYSGPVWLVNGSRDQFRVNETEFLAACRNGRLELVHGTGHLISLTRPATVTARITAAARELGTLPGEFDPKRSLEDNPDNGG